MEWKKENKEEIVKRWNREWRLLNGSIKMMKWEGVWYGASKGKLEKLK